MSDNTSIEWTDATWGPVRGCSRQSPGCDHCYAMNLAHRFNKPGMWAEGLTTIRNGKVDWKGIIELAPHKLADPLHWKKPRRVFVNSMSDLFHPGVPFDYIAAVFGVMAACPQHTFQVLTKQPRRMLKFFQWAAKEDTQDDGINACVSEMFGVREVNEDMLGTEEQTLEQFEDDTKWDHLITDPPDWPLPNVWLGVSIESPKYLERAFVLDQCPAAVRFWSVEPLLEDLGDLYDYISRRTRTVGPDWLIVGGESGPGARPMDTDWVRSIRDQCVAASVPLFVKQMGARPIENGEAMLLSSKKGNDLNEWPADLRIRESPNGER